MSNMKKIVTVATTLVFCLSTANALANPQHKGLHNQQHRDKQREMMQELDLTDTQKETIQTLHRQAKQLAYAKKRQAVFAVLTAEQQATFKANQTERQADREPGKREQKRLEKLLRMANKVNATDEQKAQLTAIHQDATTAMQNYQSNIVAHKMAQRDLIQAAEFDDSAWQSLQDDFAPTALEIGLIRSKAKSDIKQVFTPNQQQKLRKMKQRKGNKMNKENKKRKR